MPHPSRTLNTMSIATLQVWREVVIGKLLRALAGVILAMIVADLLIFAANDAYGWPIWLQLLMLVVVSILGFAPRIKPTQQKIGLVSIAAAASLHEILRVVLMPSNRLLLSAALLLIVGCVLLYTARTALVILGMLTISNTLIVLQGFSWLPPYQVDAVGWLLPVTARELLIFAGMSWIFVALLNSLISHFAINEQNLEGLISERDRATAQLQALVSERSDALQQQEALLQALLENTPSAIYVKDLHGRYLIANRHILDLHQLTIPDITNKYDHEIFGHDLSNVWRAHDLAVQQNGKAEIRESYADGQDGRHTYLEVKFPIRNRRGEIDLIGGVAIDITERKQKEAEVARQLRYAEALSRCAGLLLTRPSDTNQIWLAVAQSLEELRIALDIERMAVYQYDGALRQPTGTAHLVASTIAPLTVEMPQAPLAWNDFPSDFAETLLDRRCYGGPATTVFKDFPRLNEVITGNGIKTWMAVPIFVADQLWGHIALTDRRAERSWEAETERVMLISAEMVAAFIDRRNVFEALQRRERLLNDIGGLAMIGGWELNTQTGEIEWSDQLFVLYGIPIGQRQPLTVDEALAYHEPHDRDQLRRVFRECFEHGIGWDHELALINRDGQRRWVRSIGQPISDQRGKVIGMRGMLQDISASRHAEQLLARQLALQAALAKSAEILLMPASEVPSRWQIIGQALEQLRGLLDSSRLYIFQVQHQAKGRTLALVAEAHAATVAPVSSGAPGQSVPWEWLSVAEQQRLERGDYVVSSEILAAPLLQPNQLRGLARDERPPSYLLLPIMIDDQFWGVLGCNDTRQADSLGETRISTLHTVLELTANALRRWALEDVLRESEKQYRAMAEEHAVLYNRELKARQRLTVMQHAVQNLTSKSTVVHELYAAIHDAVAHLMPADAFVITRFDPAGAEVEDVYLVDNDGAWPGERYPQPGSFADYLLRRGRALRIDDFEQFTEHQFATFGSEEGDTRSGVATLIRGRTRILGLIFTQSYRVAAYDDDDLSMLELLAAHTATALENADLFQEIEHLAKIDGLTGLLNRRQFFIQARQDFHAAQRSERTCAIVMIDIDHFKQINDTYGHQIGDLVLQFVGHVCRNGLRARDLAGRYGGEELVLFLPDANLAAANSLAERLRRMIAEKQFLAGPFQVAISASFGVAVATPEEPLDLTSLLSRADEALYLAKQAGRNCIVAWDHSLISGSQSS